MMTAAFLVGLFLQLSFTGSFVLLANMMTYRSGAPWWYPLVFVVYGIIIFIINLIYLKKQRTLFSVSMLNGALAAAGIGISLLICRSFTFWSIAATVVIVAILTGGAITSLIGEPSLRRILFGFEISVVLIIIFAAMVAGAGAQPIWIIPGALGMAFAQGALMIKRIGRIPNAREGTLISVVILVMLIVAAVFAIFAAAPAGGGMIYVLQLIFTGIKQIGRWIAEFFAWLASFAKGEEPGAFVPTMESMEGMEAGQEIPPVTSFALAALVLMGVLLVVVVIFLLKLFGKNSVDWNIKGNAATVQLKKNRPSFREALRKLIEALKLKAKKRRFLMEYRDTPLGLYYNMENALRLGKHKKADGESPREFLDRICRACPVEAFPEKDQIFNELKDKVDGTLYGPLEIKERFSNPEAVRKIIGAVR